MLEDLDDQFEPFIMSITEPPTEQINSGSELEAETNTNFPTETTGVQGETTQIVIGPVPRDGSRFSNVYTRRKSIPDMLQVHESNPSSKP